MTGGGGKFFPYIPHYTTGERAGNSSSTEVTLFGYQPDFSAIDRISLLQIQRWTGVAAFLIVGGAFSHARVVKWQTQGT